MRVLFYAYTPFQAIASLAIKYQYYSDSESDIVLPESVQLRDKMKESIIKYRLFNRVYYADIRKFFPKTRNKLLHEFNRLKSSVNPYYIAEDIELDNPVYDVFVTTEVNYYTESIYSLLKKYNKNVRVELMDEGYSSYTYYFKEAYKPTKRKNRIKNRLFKIPGIVYGRSFISSDAKVIYYFAPELICWDDIPYEIRRINIKSDDVFHEKMNELFDYDSLMKAGLENEYERQYLYFEESFFWSMGNENDVKIIDYIAEIVGKENVAIKLHPRNEVNRFIDKGYKTNATYGVPWEVVAANLPSNDRRVFLSFSSGAVLNYKFISNNSFKTILLYKCIGDDYYHVDDSVKQWFEKFKLYYGESVFIPEDMNELDNLLKSL